MTTMSGGKVLQITDDIGFIGYAIERRLPKLTSKKIGPRLMESKKMTCAAITKYDELKFVMKIGLGMNRQWRVSHKLLSFKFGLGGIP